MYLFIDTADRKNSAVALIKQNKIIRKRIGADATKKSGDVLFAIDALLKKNKISAHKLKGIIAVNGPGQFSALRTGIAFANTFGFCLKIPVVGIPKEEGMSVEDSIKAGVRMLAKKKRFARVLPAYGKEPNITKPKNTV